MDMKNFWLYFGIVLACSGIGTTVGIILIMMYFWDDIKMTIHRNNEYHQTDSNNYEKSPSQFYNEETLEEMK